MSRLITALFIAWLFALAYLLTTGSEPCESGHGLYTGRAC